MNYLTRNLGVSLLPSSSLKDRPIRKILIVRPNHRLGNQLLISPLVQEIENTFQNPEIDLFLKGKIGKVVFQNYPSVKNYICLPKDHFRKLRSYLNSWLKLLFRNYDLVINAVPESSSGHLATKFSHSSYKIYNFYNFRKFALPPGYSHLAKKPIFNLRAQSGIAFKKPVPKLDLRLSEKEIQKGRSILRKLFQNEKDTIAFFTFATGNKCFTKEWWQQTFNFLQEEYGSEYNLLEILPKEKISQVNFEATSYYSEDLREIASVVENTMLFIAADSGIMHLGSATNTSTIGLFSVTNPEMYRPYGASNMAISVDKDFDIFRDQLEKFLRESFLR